MMNAEQSEMAGRVAIVTGGSGALGRAIIDALARAGAHAVSLDLLAPGNGRPWVQCDVREERSVIAAVESVYKTKGRLDFVVHAAGISRDSVLWKMSVEDWDSVQAVNLRGAFLLLRHSIPLLRHGRDGRIVLLGSINGSRGKFGTSAYSASKAGLLGLAKSVARELGRFGILVNVVEPGWVRTPLTDVVPQGIRDAALAESLLRSFVEPADVAASVLFLCGPGAGHITGQILRVDGGQYLGGA
jgi:3-oxoacyl-[acyl-carrier protein] reductase